MKIAMLFPYAPAYRELIYRKMDEQFDIDWFFCGDIVRPLKILDYSVLNTCDLSMSERSIVKTIHYYKGIRNLNLGKYDIIIAPPVIRCLSIWWLVWKYGNRKSGPKVYFWTHGWYGREKGLVAWLKKLFLQRTDVFLLYNQTAKYLMIDNGFDADKMYVIYNSLNYDKQLPLRQALFVDTVYSCHFNNNNRNIVFIGRLTREKRFDLLIDAVAELKGKGVMVNVTFIGDGEERKAMERRVEELGVGNQMWFYGACYDEMKNAELIFNADLCVSPGNIGLTAMHVMMFGCPAISNDDFLHQGPEFEAIQDGKTGAFFKAGNSHSLAETINRWFCDHKEDREQVRKYCYDEIDKNWNPNKQIEVLRQALYRKDIMSRNKQITPPYNRISDREYVEYQGLTWLSAA